MQVVYPTTPAQYFHCLRRQVMRRWRKPLIVMTPKSLLRHRECVSDLKEFSSGRFQRVLVDPEREATKSAKRVLLCTGKIFYELQQQRREIKGPVPVLIRLEELYPLPVEELRAAFATYALGTKTVWVQEEPENMGAWRYLRVQWDRHFSELPLECVSRPASASPATGSKTAHEREQKQLIERALGE
jgi:2-oxoglutarate dehydrogenase E1 component